MTERPAYKPMTEREVWLQAAELLVEHGDMAASYIVERAADMLTERGALDDLRRIATAVDEIAGTPATPRH